MRWLKFALGILLTANSLCWAFKLDLSRVVTVLTAQIPSAELTFALEPKGASTGLVLPGGKFVMVPYERVKKALFIEVVFPDGRSLPARFVTYDPLTGLAFLKLRSQTKERSRLVFRKNLKAGETVLLVSFEGEKEIRTGRVVRPFVYLKRGNTYSGEYFLAEFSSVKEGPVFDSKGRLCGFLVESEESRKTSSGVLVKSSFMISLAVKKFLEYGEVEWAWLGAELAPLTPAIARFLDAPVKKGVLIAGVRPFSPAERAGLSPSKRPKAIGNRVYPVGGDLVVEVEGVRIEDPRELLRAVFSKAPGEVLTLKVYRDGEYKNITIKLGRRPTR